MIFNNFLQKLMKCEKLRRWAVTRIWYFEVTFICKVARGHVDEMQIESCQVVSTYVFPCFWAMMRSRLTFSHRQMQAESCQVVSIYKRRALWPLDFLGLRFPIQIVMQNFWQAADSMVFWGGFRPRAGTFKEGTNYLIANTGYLLLNT